MPRKPKPYYRAHTKSWYCTIDGQRISLGKSKAEAEKRFHELMASREDLKAQIATCYQLTQVYLDWCERHRKSATYENHRRYLKSFIESVGKALRIAQVRQRHITQWIDGVEWTDTSKNDAISIVQRAFNWAVEEGHIQRSPLSKVAKPKRKRREIVYSSEQWKQIKSHVTDRLFLDLLDFLWATGCRPKEARTLEARHIRGQVAIFPASEAKGGEKDRVIFLTEEILPVIERLAAEHRTGPLFRNRRGNPWTKDAIKCRLSRISEKVGFRVIAYGARHAYATNALLNGVDPISLSHLMGHESTDMVARVYSHLAKNPEFLHEQARKARGSKDK
ncbi:MAG: site-specific integrase [Planctomycetales bacterium]|nr:site-specific integrase [Planctomycetales bacterium]